MKIPKHVAIILDGNGTMGKEKRNAKKLWTYHGGKEC